MEALRGGSLLRANSPCSSTLQGNPSNYLSTLYFAGRELVPDFFFFFLNKKNN